MKNILLISKIDKANHFIVGYLLYVISSLFLDDYYSLIPLAIIAFAKEIWDVVRHRMIFDWPDFLYTLAGAIPMLILNILK